MKIGIVLISHGHLASESKKVLEFITGEPSAFVCVDVEDSNDAETIKKDLKAAVHQANQGFGVLILSDLFGATPCNSCLNLLKKGEIELLSGYNLPLLLKLNGMKEERELPELLQFLIEYGRKNIFNKGLL